jgi:glycine oxidase
MIVAGAGIIGLSCAWRLAQKGVSVRVFDCRQASREASWAGAGMLAPGGELTEESPLTRMALDSLRQYPDFVAELQESSDLPIDYQRCGAIEVAFTEAEAVALERRALSQTDVGIRSEPMNYKHSISAKYSISARFYPDDQLVAPREVTNALRIACLRAGVFIHENETVTELIQDGYGVRTNLGEYPDDSVLIAAGAWSSNLLSALRPGLPPGLPIVTPVRGHLISYRPGIPLIGSILRHGHTYLLQRRDTELIAGSSTEYVGFDRSIDELTVGDIHSRAAQLLPDLAALTPADRWNGFRPGIEGGCPVVGRIEGTNIWTAYGHYRNGILLAPETARMITARMIAESVI